MSKADADVQCVPFGARVSSFPVRIKNGRPRKARPLMEGFDGAEVSIQSRTIPGTRQEQETVLRCAPGTFEWRYARAARGSEEAMLYLAGSQFAELWERAGLDGPGTVDWGKAGSAQWNGLPNARCSAMDDVGSMVRELGKMVSARLVHYTVQGKTNRAIAMIYGYGEREMAAILNADLASAARFFKYQR